MLGRQVRLLGLLDSPLDVSDFFGGWNAMVGMGRRLEAV